MSQQMMFIGKRSSLERNERARRSRRSKLHLYGAMATVVACGFGRAAQAQSDYWNNPSGGSWENASNWSQDALPGEAVFNLSSSNPYGVTLGQNESCDSITVLNNSVTVNASPGQMLQAVFGLSVNASAGQTSSFTFNGSAPYGSDGSGFVN